MQYRNTRTGCVIRAACPILGGEWEPVPDFPAPAEVKRRSKPDRPAPAGKTTRKKATT